MIAPTATLEITGGTKNVGNGLRLRNEGTVNWSSGDIVSSYVSTIIENAGTWNILGNVTLLRGGSGGRLDN